MSTIQGMERAKTPQDMVSQFNDLYTQIISKAPIPSNNALYQVSRRNEINHCSQLKKSFESRFTSERQKISVYSDLLKALHKINSLDETEQMAQLPKDIAQKKSDCEKQSKELTEKANTDIAAQMALIDKIIAESKSGKN